MNKRQLIEEATTIYWNRIERRKHEGTVVHEQPNKKLSKVEIVSGVPVVTLKNVHGVLAKIKMTPRARKRAADDILSDEQFLKELEAMSGPDDASSGGTDQPYSENEEEATGDGNGGDQRFTFQEWIQKETDSYREYLQQMDGNELIEEYRRQGGESAAYFDSASEEIVIEEE
jgi:hypothetical protein